MGESGRAIVKVIKLDTGTTGKGKQQGTQEHITPE
jgi:hypothetical protein